MRLNAVMPPRFGHQADKKPETTLLTVQPFLCSHQWSKGAAARFKVEGAEEDTFVLLAPEVDEKSPLLKLLEGKIPKGLKAIVVPQRIFDSLPQPFHN